MGHVIKEIMNGPIVTVQELNIFKASMLWMTCTTFTTKKFEHQSMFDFDMKRKKTQAWTQSWYQ